MQQLLPKKKKTGMANLSRHCEARRPHTSLLPPGIYAVRVGRRILDYNLGKRTDLAFGGIGDMRKPDVQ